MLPCATTVPEVKWVAGQTAAVRDPTGQEADFTLEFWIITAESDWTLASLCSAFRCGLILTIQKTLVDCHYELSLDTLISLAISLDQLEQDCRVHHHSLPREAPHHCSPPWAVSSSRSPPRSCHLQKEEPMEGALCLPLCAVGGRKVSTCIAQTPYTFCHSVTYVHGIPGRRADSPEQPPSSVKPTDDEA